MKLSNIINGVIDTTINITSAAAGGLVGAYVINHDMMNDQDMSVIVGATAGVGTYVVTNGALKAVKNGTVSTASKVKTKLSRKAKANSTN